MEGKRVPAEVVSEGLSAWSEWPALCCPWCRGGGGGAGAGSCVELGRTLGSGILFIYYFWGVWYKSCYHIIFVCPCIPCYSSFRESKSIIWLVTSNGYLLTSPRGRCWDFVVPWTQEPFAGMSHWWQLVMGWKGLRRPGGNTASHFLLTYCVDTNLTAWYS